MRHILHEVAKFGAGLVLGDFIALWWISTSNILPVTFLGFTMTDAVVFPGLAFDFILFIVLAHYGWKIGRVPQLRSRSFLLIAGIVFGLVACAHLLRLFVSGDIILLGWVVPMWLSWIGTAAAAYLSYMSFHLAIVKK